MEALLEAGANPNTGNPLGVLDQAQSHPEAKEALVKAGATQMSGFAAGFGSAAAVLLLLPVFMYVTAQDSGKGGLSDFMFGVGVGLSWLYFTNAFAELLM